MILEDEYSLDEEINQVENNLPVPPDPNAHVRLPTRGGSETKLTPEIEEYLFTEIATSVKGLREICEDVGITYTTFKKWLRTNPDFRRKYVIAKEEQADEMADEMIRTSSLDVGNNMADANMKKLKVSVLMFLAGKYKPKVYGVDKDKTININHNHTVDDDQFREILREAKRTKREEIGGEYTDFETISDE